MGIIHWKYAPVWSQLILRAHFDEWQWGAGTQKPPACLWPFKILTAASSLKYDHEGTCVRPHTFYWPGLELPLLSFSSSVNYACNSRFGRSHVICSGLVSVVSVLLCCSVESRRCSILVRSFRIWIAVGPDDSWLLSVICSRRTIRTTKEVNIITRKSQRGNVINVLDPLIMWGLDVVKKL